MKQLSSRVVVLACLCGAAGLACTTSSGSSSSSSSGGVNRPSSSGGSSGVVGSSAGGSSNTTNSSNAGGSSNGGTSIPGGTSTAGGSSNGGTSNAGTSTAGGTSTTGTSSGGSSGVIMDTTISAVQGATPPATGTCVRVQAVVMSVVFDDNDDEFNNVPRRAFYISEKGLTTTAPRTGIQVSANDNFMPRPTVVPGDDVTIVAQYQENFDLSLLRLTTACGGITVNGQGLALPAAAALTIEQVGSMGGGTGCPATPAWTDGAAAEDYEGVLFTLSAGTVTTATNFGETEIGNGGFLTIVKPGNGSYTAALGATIPTITGFGHYSFCRRKVRPFLLAPTECGNGPRANHLLITEIAVTPSGGEFVEIHNPTANSIDLSNYRLYNATFPGSAGSSSGGGASSSGGAGSSSGGSPGCGYWAVANPNLGRNECGTAFSDFSLRFPAGSSIGAGEYKVIAVTGAANWCAANGACANGKPDFEVPAPAGCASLANDTAVPDMLGNWDTNPQVFCSAPPPGGGANAGPFGFLTNSSEDLVLFTWDGAAATVQDVDYVVWGTNETIRTDKTGLGTYLADTPVASQSAAPAGPGNGQSLQRKCLNEGAETQTGGNGIGGNNETSEPLANTFAPAATTPRAATVGAMP